MSASGGPHLSCQDSSRQFCSLSLSFCSFLTHLRRQCGLAQPFTVMPRVKLVLAPQVFELPHWTYTALNLSDGQINLPTLAAREEGWVAHCLHSCCKCFRISLSVCFVFSHCFPHLPKAPKSMLLENWERSFFLLNWKFLFPRGTPNYQADVNILKLLPAHFGDSTFLWSK